MLSALSTQAIESTYDKGLEERGLLVFLQHTLQQTSEQLYMYTMAGPKTLLKLPDHQNNSHYRHVQHLHP
jgi:hypothetical protein